MEAGGSKKTKANFIFIWNINNFYFESVNALRSPEFVVDSIDKTKWTLKLSVPDCDSLSPGHITCALQRETVDTQNSPIRIDFQFSIMHKEGVLSATKNDECDFGINASNAGNYPYKRSEKLITVATFLEKYEKYVPGNTFTVRCQMWKSGCSVPKTELCFARTIMNIEKRSFVWTIKDICSIPSGVHRINVPPYNEGSSSIRLKISLKKMDNDDDVFQIELYKLNELKHVYCEISNIDCEGKCGDAVRQSLRNVTFVHNKCLLFQKIVRKEELIEKPDSLLANGALNLQCDFQLYFGVGWSKIENYTQESSEFGATPENNGRICPII